MPCAHAHKDYQGFAGPIVEHGKFICYKLATRCILYYIILYCYVMLCYVMLCYVMLCYVM